MAGGWDPELWNRISRDRTCLARIITTGLLYVIHLGRDNFFTQLQLEYNRSVTTRVECQVSSLVSIISTFHFFSILKTNTSISADIRLINWISYCNVAINVIVSYYGFCDLVKIWVVKIFHYLFLYSEIFVKLIFLSRHFVLCMEIDTQSFLIKWKIIFPYEQTIPK